MNYWDRYFLHHGTYKPTNGVWGLADLDKSYRWYINWFVYINKILGTTDFKGKQVLEIGCGIGGVCKILYEKEAIVKGTDVSYTVLKIAQKIQPAISFSFLNIEKKLRVVKKYDYVFAFEVLEHVANLDNTVKNIKSLLKPNGIFIGSTPYPFSKNLLDPTHKNVLYPNRWRQLFQNCGFQNVIVKPLSFPPLLWKLHPALNIPLPWYIRHTQFVSTTLIIAFS